MAQTYPSLANTRQSLRWAIFRGTLSAADALEGRSDTIADIFGCDSLEWVELVMALEAKGTKLQTVGDLMAFMDGVIDSAAKED